MGKEEILHFFSVSSGIFGFFWGEGGIWIFYIAYMFIEESSTFHLTFVQIGEFDWLSMRRKGSIFVKNI